MPLTLPIIKLISCISFTKSFLRVFEVGTKNDQAILSIFVNYLSYVMCELHKYFIQFYEVSSVPIKSKIFIKEALILNSNGLQVQNLHNFS